MINPPQFICWQPVLTDHQAYTLAALATAADGEIITVAVARTVAERAGQGWLPLGLKSLDPIILSRWSWTKQAWRLLHSQPEAIHLFCSPFGDVRITFAMLVALVLDRRVYLVSEPYSPVSVGTLNDRHRKKAAWKALLRPSLYRIYGFLLRRKVAGIFAISPLAVNQYRAIGISDHKIFAFGYFVASQPVEAQASMPPRQGLHLCFVGSLITRKGAAHLATAARQAVTEGAMLSVDIYGPGDASHLGDGDNVVRYGGTINFGTAGAVMVNYDALVVPSEHDGWGVVVNEAIMAGVPVIASSRVGAAAMVARWKCGLVYDGTLADGLKSALHTVAQNPEALKLMRQSTASVAPLLTPAVAGSYMWAAIKGAVEPCPWYEKP
jgi:glycosyltransferase involved in cell wall biosynthesis